MTMRVGVADCVLVIEAATENAAVKAALFAELDTGMTLGCAHPMGPLRLGDLIGLDTLQSIAEAMHGEYAEPRYAPPPLLRRMTAAGLHGRKTGRGFYGYQARGAGGASAPGAATTLGGRRP